ncbi:hypothetical protein HK096_002067, partial [Nowakowskiella sp. JEL0078]
MKPLILITILLPLALAGILTVDLKTTHQTWEGVGVSQAFGTSSHIKNLPSALQSQILDLLFSSTGANFNIIRNLLPSASWVTIEPTSPGSPSATATYSWDNSSWNQVWLTNEAVKRG